MEANAVPTHTGCHCEPPLRLRPVSIWLPPVRQTGALPIELRRHNNSTSHRRIIEYPKIQCSRWVSNPQPSDLQSDAHPFELQEHKKNVFIVLPAGFEPTPFLRTLASIYTIEEQ